jgi:DNA primase
LVERPIDTKYTEGQVRAVLTNIGVEIKTETGTDFLCACPFHDNRHSPAFTISKEKGLWLCFNGSCDGSRGGNLEQLVMRVTGREDMEAKRFIAKKETETRVPLSENIDKLFIKHTLPTIPQRLIDSLHQNFKESLEAIEYMEGRGFELDTVLEFEVGYDVEREMITVPIHDKDGNPIGLNGRSIEGKYFKLSKGLPRNEVLFNLHRAKRHSTVIVCESQFDAMRIHQAGYPNAVCAFGSHWSAAQLGQLERFFERVIIFTDNDEPGIDSGMKIAAALRHLSVRWSHYDFLNRTPDVTIDGETRPAKDAGEMSDRQIKQCIERAIPHIEFEGMLQ